MVLVDLLKQNIWIIILGVLIIISLLSFLKTLVKWVLVYVIVIGVSYVLINDYKEITSVDVSNKLKSVESTFLADLQKEVKYLTYFDEKNGGFTLKSDNILIYGILDSKKVNVIYKGEKYVFDKNPTIEKIIKEKRDAYLKYKYNK